ncbi:MAG TPA: aspartate carbamoyltransferase [Candidatus Binatia bacterium]|nr:aspartate carbamoyltransferase [Candidatus Binatia bacterium]
MSVFKGRDIVSIDQLTTDELLYFVNKAKEFKARAPGPIADGNSMAYAFFESSTRTRISFLKAAADIGMGRFGFGSAESTSVSKNESVHHTLKMLEGYRANALVIRHKLEGAAQYAADKLDIPVINAGDGRHEHPTQTLIDLLSIEETQGRLSDLKIGLVGDLKYGRTVHSLIKAMRKFPNNTFQLVHPPQLELPGEYWKGHDDLIASLDLERALRSCDVLYMTRIQLERIDDPRERSDVLGHIQLKPEMCKSAKKNLKVLHPLPIDAAHPEIVKTFDRECPQHAYYFQQAANGLPVRQVLLAAVTGSIGNDFRGKPYQQPLFTDTNALVSLPFSAKKREYDSKDYTIKPVHTGTVIDHIPDQLSWTLAHQLGLDSKDRFARGRTAHATGLSSKTLKTKDVLMIYGYELSEADSRIVAMVAPGVTINTIRNGEVVAKYKTQLPDKIQGILECVNERCVSNDAREDAPSVFYVTQREPTAELSCHYCDTVHGMAQGNLKTVLR